MRTIKDSKWTYVALSLLFAVVLWLYVTTTLNPEQDSTVRNVQVVFTGADVLEQRGLMISEGAEQSLSLYVRAKREVLVNLQNNPVTVEVDVAGIQSPGQYTQGAKPVYTSAGVANSQVNIKSPNPLNIQFTVSRRTDRIVEVRGDFSGSVAEGFQKGDFSFTPASVTVSGQEELVNQVAYAKVTLTRDNLSETFSGEMPFTLVGFDDQPLEGVKVDTNVNTVQVTLPVVQLKEVPLTVEVLSGGGATADNAEITIEPESIMVSGSEADLEGLKEISLGSIDLQKVFSGNAPKQIPFPIYLDAALTNVSGVTTATVSVQITNLATRIIEVDNIQFINEPEGYQATAVTQTRQVQIRGTQEAVDAVIPAQLSIVADLTDIPLATGNQTWPVKVYLNGSSNVGVVGDYNISISITR